MRRVVAAILIAATTSLTSSTLALFALARGGRLIAAAGGPADLLPIPSLWYLIPAIAALVAVVVAVWLLSQERSLIKFDSDGASHFAETPVRTVNRWLESESNYLSQVGRVA